MCFSSPDEEQALRELAAKGVAVTAQDVPGARPVSLDDLLGRERAVSFVDLIPLALLGGVLGLDVVSFPQAMISRPLVAATLAGALIGEAASGVLLGAALELIALETLPFGASRYPEWGSASVVGGAIFASHPSHPAGAMTLAVLAALATTWVGGWTMVKLRQRNAVWAGQRREALEAGARGTVISLQLMGMTADLVRGALLTAIAYASLSPLADWCMRHWSMDARLSRAIVVAAAASVAGGAAWKLFHSTTGARWFFVGGLGGRTLLPVSPMTGRRDRRRRQRSCRSGRAWRSSFACSPFRARGTTRSCSGNGIGFCIEPALRLLPGGIHTPAFHQALARESRYFNAHPYLASVAVGALARAELDGEDPVRIERFRTALCGPLGSVGDRLVWAGWLPFCSLASLAVFGLGGEPGAGRRAVSRRCTTSDISGCASGGSTRDGTMGFASRRRSAIRCFVVVRSRSVGSPRWRPASRFRWRSAASSDRGAISWAGCWSPSRSDRFSSSACRVASKGGGCRSSCWPSSSSSR